MFCCKNANTQTLKLTPLISGIQIGPHCSEDGEAYTQWHIGILYWTMNFKMPSKIKQVPTHINNIIDMLSSNLLYIL